MLLHDEEDARAFVAARCSKTSLAKLKTFVSLLREVSSTQNLIAQSTMDSVWLRHMADSAQLLDHVSRETSPWLDLGSGAGFPGLIVALMQPDREVVLVESRRLRVQWLTEACSTLEITNCQVLGLEVGRAESFPAAVISARAFAPLVRLIEVSARFSTNATEWVLPKGRSAEQEVARLPPELQSRFHVKQSVTDSEARILVARGHFAAS